MDPTNAELTYPGREPGAPAAVAVAELRPPVEVERLPPRVTCARCGRQARCRASYPRTGGLSLPPGWRHAPESAVFLCPAHPQPVGRRGKTAAVTPWRGDNRVVARKG